MKIITGTVEKPDLEDNNIGDLGKTITIDMTGSTESSKPPGLLCSRAEEPLQPDDRGPLIFMVFFIVYWAVIVWYVVSYPW